MRHPTVFLRQTRTLTQGEGVVALARPALCVIARPVRTQELSSLVAVWWLLFCFRCVRLRRPLTLLLVAVLLLDALVRLLPGLILRRREPLAPLLRIRPVIGRCGLGHQHLRGLLPDGVEKILGEVLLLFGFLLLLFLYPLPLLLASREVVPNLLRLLQDQLVLGVLGVIVDLWENLFVAAAVKLDPLEVDPLLDLVVAEPLSLLWRHLERLARHHALLILLILPSNIVISALLAHI